MRDWDHFALRGRAVGAKAQLDTAVSYASQGNYYRAVVAQVDMEFAWLYTVEPLLRWLLTKPAE